MRVIHLARASGNGHVLPRCGSWGSMATYWTEVAAGVTCVACRDAMRDGARDRLPVGGHAAEPARPPQGSRRTAG